MQNLIERFKTWLKYGKSLRYLVNGKFDLAVRLFEECVKDEPYDWRSYKMLGITYVHKEDAKRAIQNLNKALEIISQLQIKRIDSDIYAYLGYCYLIEKQADQSIAAYKKALEYWKSGGDIGKTSIFYDLANALDEKGNYTEAIKYYKEAIKLNNKNPDYYSGLASCYYKKADYSEAVKYYKEAITLNDKNSHYYYGLGLSYQRTEDYSEAIKYFEKAIELDGKQPGYYYNLGRCYYASKQTENALDAFQNAVKLDPKLSEDKTIKEIINQN